MGVDVSSIREDILRLVPERLRRADSSAATSPSVQAARPTRPTPAAAVGEAAPGRRSALHLSEAQPLSNKQLEDRRLIHYDESRREQADAFRQIRTQLLALGGDRNFVTLVVPVSPGSGGSYVARNLAAAFAFDDAKTALLIDCNLRHPSQHLAFGMEPGSGGLLDYLDRPSLGIDRINYRTGISRLRMIPAGKPGEVHREYFMSFRMRAIIDSLRCRYTDRYLFLDGPAVKGSPDARILSELADYVVLVAGSGRDTPDAVRRALAAFDPAKVAGTVFNELP